MFYVSGHGFGHASRDIEVINALLARHPDLRIVVRTTAARWLFDLTVRGAIAYEPSEVDTGIVQIDSLRLDAEASVREAARFMAGFDARVDAEAAALHAHQAALVVVDIPPLGVAAARRAGVPVVALGNFTWEWAYAAYRGSAEIVRAMARAYAGADIALRLPMWGGFEAFARVVDIPFIARRSSRGAAETRAALGVPDDRPLVLSSFGGHGVDGFDLERLGAARDYVFLFSGSIAAGLPVGAAAGSGAATPANVIVFDERRMYGDGLRYEDVVRAVDVVVSKPGYGIIAECLANDSALLYTSRGHFIEYDVLVGAMPRFLRAAFIDHCDLVAGRWAPSLDTLLAQPPPPEAPPTNGADVAADLLLEMLR